MSIFGSVISLFRCWLLGNLSTGKGTIRADEGKIRVVQDF